MTTASQLLLGEVAKLEAMGDLYDYEPEVNRVGRKTFVALVLWFAVVAIVGSKSCQPPGEVQSRPDAYAIR